MASTCNGALSYNSSSSSCLDLFFKLVRDIPVENLKELLKNSWEESPLDTIKIIFQGRDCRNGKGDRKPFVEACAWLAKHHVHDLLENLHLVPLYGRWKDLFELLGESPLIDDAVFNLVKDQLMQDLSLLESSNPETKYTVSLLAKWFPTEGSRLDIVHSIYKSVAIKLIGTEENKSLKLLRKKYISPLRNHLRLVESKMSKNQWNEIEYSHVPSCAMKKYASCFKLKSSEHFDSWINDVKQGYSKVNAKMLYPHDIVSGYDLFNELKELQWKVLAENLLKDCPVGTLERTLCMSDVSGSMTGTPMEVSVALGLLISNVTSGPYHNHVLTFDSNPILFHVNQQTLFDRCQTIRQAPWGGSTNIQAAFDLILETAITNNADPSLVPNRVLIISDMQFDQANENNEATNFEVLRAKFEKHGYDFPQIVFWNVRGDTNDFPASCDIPGVAMLSGYSPALLKSVLSGSLEVTHVPNSKQLTGYEVFRNTIDHERYSKLHLSKITSITKIPSGYISRIFRFPCSNLDIKSKFQQSKIKRRIKRRRLLRKSTCYIPSQFPIEFAMNPLSRSDSWSSKQAKFRRDVSRIRRIKSLIRGDLVIQGRNSRGNSFKIKHFTDKRRKQLYRISEND